MLTYNLALARIFVWFDMFADNYPPIENGIKWNVNEKEVAVLYIVYYFQPLKKIL